MLAAPKRAFIGIGSANLTRDGIASNLEILSFFEVSPSKPEFAPILRECVDYVQRLAEQTKSEHAIDQVDVFRQSCRPYLVGATDNELKFIHNLDRPILDQIVARLGNQHVQKIQIISPFFDVNLEPLAAFRHHFPNSRFEIYIQQSKSNFPRESLPPKWSYTSLWLYEGIDRYLHGKGFLIYTDNRIWLFMGSANFTSSALMASGFNGSNLEIGMLGPVDENSANDLLCPIHQAAIEVENITQVHVNPRPEFNFRSSGWVEYIGEAVRKDDQITIRVNPDISKEEFSPKEFRLIDFFGNIAEGPIGTDLTIKLTPDLRKIVTGKLAVQLAGVNKLGETLESNRVWIVELEEGSLDPMRSRIRRIRNDPSAFFEILKEIAAEGDEWQLVLFLRQFDIPLDILLPPWFQHSPRNVKSRGNVIGGLPIHQGSFFSHNLLDATVGWLERHYGKLEKHNQELQTGKISNFILIFNELFVLNDFTSAWVRDKYMSETPITIEDWGLVRDCYDFLLEYVSKTWTLVWSDEGYSNRIDAKLASKAAFEEQEGFPTFRQYLLANYGGSLAELKEFVLRPSSTFQYLKSQLRVKIPNGNVVMPKVFATGHPYLQEEGLKDVEKLVTALG